MLHRSSDRCHNMPNIIPPIVSSSPPPLVGDDDIDEDNDFGEFTTAEFSFSDDPTASKSISDTSWSPKLPSPNPTSHTNGIPSSSGELKVIDEDEEILQNVDSASQDFVVSSFPDSGHCTGGQNSNGPSPMPHLVNQDLCTKLQRSDKLPVGYQNGDLKPVGDTHGKEKDRCSSPSISEQNFSDSTSVPHFGNASSDLVSECDSPFECQNGSVLTQTSDISAAVAVSVSRAESPEVSTKTPNNHPKNSTTCGVEESELGESLTPPSSELPNSNNGDDGFGDWTGVESPPKSVDDPLEEGRDSEDEDEFVRAMVIPDIPLPEDGFGEFSAFEASNQPGNSHDGNEFDAFDTPSRRPTLALDETEFSPFNTPSRRPTLAMGENEFSLHVNSETDVGFDECASSPNVLSIPSGELNCESEPQADERSTEEAGSDEGKGMVESASEPVPSFENPAGFQSSDPSALDDEFADFAQAEITAVTDKANEWVQASSFNEVPPAASVGPLEPSETDDFDDFESAEFQSADTASSSQAPSAPSVDFKQVQSRVPEILKELFPLPEELSKVQEAEHGSCGLGGIILDVEESVVWQGLRDLETTPSLSFHWPGSHSNRGLLGALNIDSRNILFGPKWNTVVPRFAANLGFSPLEPVRAAQAQPRPELAELAPRQAQVEPQPIEPMSKPTSSSSNPAFQEIVPAAQFDWSDSGLTNPLEFNKEQIGASISTIAGSGNPALSSVPLKVEQLLANVKSSSTSSSATTAVISERKPRDPNLSPEAVQILESLPELAFLSARMLMFPMQSDSKGNKL